jgi:hypothetical protein
MDDPFMLEYRYDRSGGTQRYLLFFNIPPSTVGVRFGRIDIAKVGTYVAHVFVGEDAKPDIEVSSVFSTMQAAQKYLEDSVRAHMARILLQRGV